MKNLKKLLSILLVAVLCMALLAGCGSAEPAATEAAPAATEAPAAASAPAAAETPAERPVIKMGGNGLYAQNVEMLAEVVKDKYDIQLVTVDSNSGCVEGAIYGDIDAFMYNHEPWLKIYNEANNTNFMVVEPLFYTRNALYSDKHEKLEDLPDGATIAICNDSVNMQNNLLFLETLGLITMGEKADADSFLTTLDVIDNPKNIQFVEVEISYAVRCLEDCDAAVVSASYVLSAGKDPNKFLAEDYSKVDYPIGLTILEEDANEQWVADLAAALKSEEYAKMFNESHKGAMVLY